MKLSFLDWRLRNLWGKKGLASVGMSVGFAVQWRVILVDVIAPVDTHRGPNKIGTDLGRRGNASSKTACTHILYDGALLCC